MSCYYDRCYALVQLLKRVQDYNTGDRTSNASGILCRVITYSLAVTASIHHRNQKMHKLRNQSEQTVRRQPVQLTLLIYYQEQQVLKLNIMNNETVADLVDQVRRRLARSFENIVGLASVEGYYTLDYALQRPECRLNGIRNNQRLQLILEDIVADQTRPTLADFNFLACLGEGISASVFLVRHTPSGQLYALKQIKKEYFREFKTLQSVLRQKKILTEIVADLPFATKLQASFQSQQHLNLLLEFCPGGEFFFHLTQKKLTEEEAKLCFAEIMLTMEQLHKRKVLYRDLKPENIMVDFQGHLRLGDFGLCRINLEPQDFAYSHCGSPEYMAYETKESEGYSYPADFYTMGAIIYEMVKGVPPFFKGETELSFNGTSPGFRALVEDLIRENPQERLCDYTEIKKSAWLRNINWQKVKNKQQMMPTRLNLYTNYIHAQFIEKRFNWGQLSHENRYDKLFDMFFYLRDSPEGISPYYPFAKKSKKPSTLKNKVCKDNSRNSSKKKDRGSSQSSQHSNRSKSKEKNNNFFRKKTNKENNIYTGLGGGMATERQKNELSYKSASKKKEHSQNKHGISKEKASLYITSREPAIAKSKSPGIKFKTTIGSVKSSGNLKGAEYLKQLDKSASKKKMFK